MTLQDTTQSAWLFNLCMEALCKQVDNFGYNVVSTLNENEDFIEIEVMLRGIENRGCLINRRVSYLTMVC